MLISMWAVDQSLRQSIKQSAVSDWVPWLICCTRTYLGIKVPRAARVLEGQARVALLGHQHTAVVHLLEL
jgi:hypothetical protein